MKLLRNKDIKVNGKRVSSDVTLSVGDNVEIFYSPKKQEKYSIIYKDENVVVINKKSGYSFESIYTDLTELFSDVYAVHRLDRNTSGIMIFALNFNAEGELLQAFKNHQFIKIYTAEVFGKLPKKHDVLTAYLTKDSKQSFVKISNLKTPNSYFIKTEYMVVEEKEKTSLVKIRLWTGKTHQIRAHLAFIGNSIVGDGKYGNNALNKEFKASSQKLTATELTLNFSEQSFLFYLNGKTFSINEQF